LLICNKGSAKATRRSADGIASGAALADASPFDRRITEAEIQGKTGVSVASKTVGRRATSTPVGTLTLLDSCGHKGQLSTPANTQTGILGWLYDADLLATSTIALKYF